MFKTAKSQQELLKFNLFLWLSTLISKDKDSDAPRNPIHRCKEVQQLWSKWEDMGLYILFLPKSCSEMNPIELEWQHLKKDELASKTFDDELDLAYAVMDGVQRRGEKRNYSTQRVRFADLQGLSTTAAQQGLQTIQNVSKAFEAAAIGATTSSLVIADALQNLPSTATELAAEMPKIANRLRYRAGLRVGDSPPCLSYKNTLL
ncbi:MAG: transposase [Heteroscytonema crispum UTEX LB 1556]